MKTFQYWIVANDLRRDHTIFFTLRSVEDYINLNPYSWCFIESFFNYDETVDTIR